MGIYRKIDKTVILPINSHLIVHTSFIKSRVCARAMTLGLCCFGTVFRLHRYTNLVYVHFKVFNLFIDLTINSYTNPCNLASSRLLWVWLPCDKSHPRENGRRGRIDLGSCPYRLSRENFLAIPLCMHGGYVGSFLLSIKLIISFLFNKKNWCMTRYRQTKVFFARVYTK